jgi:hypothetical protein
MSAWIKHSDQQPGEGEAVIYFFDMVGVHRGHYDGQDCYYGERGFLTGDVTHWMPDHGGPLPPKPAHHPLYPNARGDCYACSIAVNTEGVGCAAHGIPTTKPRP